MFALAKQSFALLPQRAVTSLPTTAFIPHLLIKFIVYQCGCASEMLHKVLIVIQNCALCHCLEAVHCNLGPDSKFNSDCLLMFHCWGSDFQKTLKPGLQALCQQEVQFSKCLQNTALFSSKWCMYGRKVAVLQHWWWNYLCSFFQVGSVFSLCVPQCSNLQEDTQNHLYSLFPCLPHHLQNIMLLKRFIAIQVKQQGYHWVYHFIYLLWAQ